MSGSAVAAEVQTTYSYETSGDVRRARLTAQATRVCVGPSGDHLSCASSTLLGSDAYEYDKNDSISRVTEDNGSGAVTHYYCYGGRGELLTRRTGADCASATADEAYAYDATGNITAATGGGLQVSYTYTQSSPSAPVSVVTVALTVYSDSAGLTTKVAGGASDWAYLYDAEGRLASACRSSSCSGTGFDRADYAYDGAGHRTRITATVYSGGTPATTVRNIAYSGDAPAQETDGAGAVLRTYVTDGTGRITGFTDRDALGADHVYAVAWSAHGDALSVSEVDPATGAATAANRYAYQTWGRPATATANGYPDLRFRYLWVGASDVQWDDAAGEALYYMHARTYSPALGRFLQPDPARADGSLYAYAGNSPVTKGDPSGLYQEVNSFERKLCGSNPNECLVWGLVSKWAMTQSNRVFGSWSAYHDGKGDACRHCVWQALLVRTEGYAWAMRWANAHEYSDPYGFPASESDARLSRGTRMDLRNNVIGRTVGLQARLQGRGASWILERCLGLIRSGALLYYGDDRWAGR